MVNKSNITELSIEEKDFKITIKQKEERVVAAAPVQVYQQPAPAPAPSVSAPASSASGGAPQKQEADNLLTIKSPMIGTFYRKPAPGKPNFVEEGDEVRSGKVVCVIEAMK
ncbi:MAG: acetyl-CoA carboxylase biotin carboxyl carrier protein, partial [bacterium]